MLGPCKSKILKPPPLKKGIQIWQAGTPPQSRPGNTQNLAERKTKKIPYLPVPQASGFPSISSLNYVFRLANECI